VRRAPAPAADRPGDGARAPGRPLRILVVDDNRDAADSLAILVELMGHDVEVAFDGPEAVARARRRAPHVVLCDIGLPGMDGHAVAQALRAEHGGAMRLVAVSGYALPEDVDRARAAGFDEHIAKPPDPARIERVLAARSSEEPDTANALRGGVTPARGSPSGPLGPRS
jgi:CheY-like chemotaxis protein